MKPQKNYKKTFCDHITFIHPLMLQRILALRNTFFAFSFADFFLILSQMEKFLFSGKRRCAKEQENN